MIDLTPEGKRPPANTAVFAIETEVAIGIFVRKHGELREAPATIHHATLTGSADEKTKALNELNLDSPAWRPVRSAWTAPFLPAADSDWDHWPAVGDLMPWSTTGIGPNRRWVYATSVDILNKRWRLLVAEHDAQRKAKLFKETFHASLDRPKAPLSGLDTYKGTTTTFRSETGAPPTPVRVGYRFLDRQWLIPDARLMHTPSTHLWAARIPNQIFVTEQHAHEFKDGPSLGFSALIPDKDYFDGRGGRILPLLHPDGSPNLATGLLGALAERLAQPVTPGDVIAYFAAVTGHPTFLEAFEDELKTPGVRVPITVDSSLWSEAVVLGKEALWAHTFGRRFVNDRRPAGAVRYPSLDHRRILSSVGVERMPESLNYDPETLTLEVGTGRFGPVPQEVRDYEVGGRNVLDSWFGYRKAAPGGRKSSPLDDIHVDVWPADWTEELIDLLSTISRLTELEPAQADLLERIVSGTCLSSNDLANSGVRWPQTKMDRAPRYRV